MALLGLAYPRFAVMDASTEVLETGKILSKIIKADIKITTSEVELYGDDMLCEAIKEFVEGTISTELTNLSLEMQSIILGNTYTALTTNTVANSEDTAPFIRLGFISSVILDNKRTYRVTIFSKIKFSIPDESLNTKGKTSAFSTPTINGKIYRSNNGTWKETQDFTTIALAEAFLNSKVNYTPPVVVTP